MERRHPAVSSQLLCTGIMMLASGSAVPANGGTGVPVPVTGARTGTLEAGAGQCARDGCSTGVPRSREV